MRIILIQFCKQESFAFEARTMPTIVESKNHANYIYLFSFVAVKQRFIVYNEVVAM
jgi:hypothetical protein